MMRRHPRLRRFLKWTGFSLCLGLLLIWAGSFAGLVSYNFATSGWDGHIYISAGTAQVGWTDPRAWIPRGLHVRMEPNSPLKARYWPKVITGTRPGGPPSLVIFKYLVVPFWIILLPVAIPTALLFWRDRRRILPGHCPCGYDLTGNTSGLCPECGREVTGAES